ncbi:elongator complex protein 2 [Euwallacea similis]|uniref:elongator complex protein 2 n=1 Tax=Euwallacea similis TaxID=1736056 RepID=UPI00344F6C6F
MTMDFKNVYVSSNCNQVPTSADCSNSNLIAYGSSNVILIYDPNLGSGGKVTHTLVSHKKRVNTVRWIRGVSNSSHELVSGATDGTLVVWSLIGTAYVPTLISESEFQKNLSVNIVDGCYSNGNTIVCSAAIHTHSLRIWVREVRSSDFILQQSFLFGHKSNPSFVTGLRLGQISTSRPIIACAVDNCKIQILIQNHTDSNWIIGATLSGHEDWVRGLDFVADEKGDLLLASCSQDTFIRIWRLSETKVESSEIGLLETSLESVIAGHEGWVYSVQWNPTKLQLLSASIDKSMIIWEFNIASGLWLEKIRVGEVGGNTLGFYGGFFNGSGDQIIGHSYHGAFHIWAKNESGLWDPCVTVGGHFGEVVDLAWEPEGEFLYSVGADQTARIHAPWQKDNKEVTWHEIARPQIHGFDLSSIAVISRYKYASGAEEKVIRTFEAPETFVENVKSICHIHDSDVKSNSTFIPKGASVPSLGLSNKAIFSEDNLEDTLPVDKNPYPEESHFKVQILTEPPTEETLLQNTLWPETQKLYGHGYEIFSLAASPDGKFLASACKSTKLQHAAILIWDTLNWQQIQQLVSHSLTVVQMQFSPDSQHLLSVSRDRRWSVFSKKSDMSFELAATTNKQTAVHTRIIWACAWTHDSKYFATGSREGKVVMWTKNPLKDHIEPLGQYEPANKPLDFPNESVTALAFAPGLVNGNYLCAIGCENGSIELFSIGNMLYQKLLHLSVSFGHHMTVRKLAFRPKFGRAGSRDQNSNVLQLSSASSDMSVKIYDLFL